MGDTKPLTKDFEAIEDEFQYSSEATTSLASQITNQTALSANPNRKAFSLFNDSTSNAFVKFGATASSTSFHVKLAAGAFYESKLPTYKGQIDVIWDVANGNMRITEGT